MKLSTKGRYGLRILMDLALNESNDRPRMIHDIATAQKISEKYISRLVIALRKAKMVKSIRGAKGGFKLAIPPSELTVLAIVEAMEGPLAIVDCLGSHSSCKFSGTCAPQVLWQHLNEEIREAMRKVTLQDVLDSYRSLNASSYEYII